ncbi:DMT family transporter [Paenibacillus caui]|uniref:DMT family transporter n=1 Tax=Paenibacillus caui TaxID=2873927 RepID=UPI001CA8CA0B|nr:EamA family transporter [Paenibacillus caui]
MVAGLYALMCLIFGTTFLVIKIGIEGGAPPLLSAGIRFVVAGLVMLMFLKAKHKNTLSLLWKKETAIVGATLTFGTFSALYWAEQYISSGLAAILSATGPLMILIIQSLIHRTKPARPAMLGCITGLAGVLVIMLPSVKTQVSLTWMAGCLVILAGEISYASGTVYARKLSERFANVSPLALNAAQMLYGGLFLILLSSATEYSKWTWTALEASLNTASISSILYLIVFGSMVGHSIYYWLVSKTNPIFPSTWLYVSPLIAIILGAVFYQENVTWELGLGAVAIVAGIVLINSQSWLKRTSKNAYLRQR